MNKIRKKEEEHPCVTLTTINWIETCRTNLLRFLIFFLTIRSNKKKQGKSDEYNVGVGDVVVQGKSTYITCHQQIAFNPICFYAIAKV